MAGSLPVRRLVCLTTLACCCRADPPPAAVVTGTSSTAAPAIAVAPAPAPSEKLQRLFGDHLPKYQPPTSPPDADSGAADPRNRIVRLPTYVVRETRPIREEDVITQAAREHEVAMRYGGPQNRVDEALNTVTLDGLWKSIPILGKIPFVPFGSMTYDQRVALTYERIEQKRRFSELMGIENLAAAAESKKAAPPKK